MEGIFTGWDKMERSFRDQATFKVFQILFKCLDGDEN